MIRAIGSGTDGDDELFRGEGDGIALKSVNGNFRGADESSITGVNIDAIFNQVAFENIDFTL